MKRGMNGVADLDEPEPAAVEVVVGPVEVRVAVRVHVREVGVAVRIRPRGLCIGYHPHHHPSNTLWVEFYLEPESSQVSDTK